MKIMHLVLFVLIGLTSLRAGENPGVELKVNSLIPALDMLSSKDQAAVSQAIELIKKGENTAALIQLTALNEGNPENSSLRILSAYVKLQLGNLLGAFDDAQKGETAPNGNSYKCWFLAKLALLSGQSAICEREIKHIQHDPAMKQEANSLKGELERKKKS